MVSVGLIVVFDYRQFVEGNTTDTMTSSFHSGSTKNAKFLKILQQQKVNFFSIRLLDAILAKEDKKLIRIVKNLETHEIFVIEQVKKSCKFCAAAAMRGRLSVIKFLRKHGFDWDEQTATNAFTNRHGQILKYVVSNGAPLDKKAIENAAYLHEDVSMFKLFIEHLHRLS